MDLVQNIFLGMKMGSKRISTDDIHLSEFKKPKITLEEDIILVIEDVEEVEYKVKEEKKEVVEIFELDEPQIPGDSVIFLLHICIFCDMELDCAPGDLVMKTHYISHFPPGSLLELVSKDVGEKLRCPYFDCHTIGEGGMSLQQLNLHLEVEHNKLKMLMEKDDSPAMAEVLSIMYDNYKDTKVNINTSENDSSLKYEEEDDVSVVEEFLKADPVHIVDVGEDDNVDPVDEEEERNDPSWTPEGEDSSDEEQPDVQSNTASDDENFHCEKCDLYFSSTRALGKHKRGCTREVYQCQYGDMNMVGTEAFREHLMSHRETFKSPRGQGKQNQPDLHQRPKVGLFFGHQEKSAPQSLLQLWSRNPTTL